MQVSHLRLFQYRNFDHQEMEFCPGTNLLFGSNGQGKTNLLESLYLLGYGKSFRTATSKECIQHDRQTCRVDGSVEHGGMNRELGISLSLSGERQLLLHRKPVGIGEFIGNLHTLAFTQEHLKVVRGAPAERRAFLDRAMISACPGHMQHLAAYSRALKQRNRLLGNSLLSGRQPDREELDCWDERLIVEGSRILLDRKKYVEEMKRELVRPLCATEQLEIRYFSTASKNGRLQADIESEFRENLRAARPNDERRGFTTVGPHRDELKMTLNGKPLAEYGSAGQQRSSLLALYFAQMEIHRRNCGFYPVFLMDDVEAELDDQRLQAFLEHLAKRTQTFLTTAKEKLLPPLGDSTRRFLVRGGKVEIIGK